MGYPSQLYAAFALTCVPLVATACGGRMLADGNDEVSADVESESDASGDEIDDSDQTTGIPNCEVIEFTDPALEHYVRDALGIEDGLPLDGDDMVALTTIHVERLEFGESVKLHGFSGLECAVNLEELTWEDGVALDFEGLEPLTGLSKLRIVVLAGGPIIDLGQLAGLSQLEVLSWHGLETANLAPLAGLTSLRTLHLPHNQITDISPLAGLTNLEELDLFSSPSFDSAIVDISALAGLGNLKRLNIDNNQIVDVSPLAGLAELEELSLEVNAVVDIGPLANLPALHTLRALGNPIVDISPLASFPQIYHINLGATQITDLSALIDSNWQTPMGCADISLVGNPLTEQTIEEDLPQICAANPSVAIWIGMRPQEAFCNPTVVCP